MKGKQPADKQLRLLNVGDALELSKFKKRTKLEVDKVFSSKQREAVLFENRIDLLNIEELAVIFGLAPQTIRNWVALGKIPHVKIGRKWFFQKRSLQRWLNQKEEPQWE